MYNVHDVTVTMSMACGYAAYNTVIWPSAMTVDNISLPHLYVSSSFIFVSHSSNPLTFRGGIFHKLPALASDTDVCPTFATLRIWKVSCGNHRIDDLQLRQSLTLFIVFIGVYVLSAYTCSLEMPLTALCFILSVCTVFVKVANLAGLCAGFSGWSGKRFWWFWLWWWRQQDKQSSVMSNNYGCFTYSRQVL